MAFCEKELFKINVFYEEKLAEAKRKFDVLRKEMDALALEYQQGHDRRHSYLRSSIGRLVSGVAASPSPPLEQSIKSSAASLRQRQSLLTQPNPSNGSQLIPSLDGSLPRHSLQLSPDPAACGSPPPHHKSEMHLLSGASGPQVPISVQFRKRTSRPTIMSYGAISNKLLPHNQQQANGNCVASFAGIDKKKLNDIKLAFSEFYLSLVLLQNYQRLNFTGLRKILKKHDKLFGNEDGKRWHHTHVESAFFHTNKDVDKLIEETENIVTYQLEAGDRPLLVVRAPRHSAPH